MMNATGDEFWRKNWSTVVYLYYYSLFYRSVLSDFLGCQLHINPELLNDKHDKITWRPELEKVHSHICEQSVQGLPCSPTQCLCLIENIRQAAIGSRSDYANAQARIGLRCLYMLINTFSHAGLLITNCEAHLQLSKACPAFSIFTAPWFRVSLCYCETFQLPNTICKFIDLGSTLDTPYFQSSLIRNSFVFENSSYDVTRRCQNAELWFFCRSMDLRKQRIAL